MATEEYRGSKEVIVPEALSEPIPDLSTARKEKEGYRDWPIDASTSYHDQELVDIAEKSLSGQAYYSRNNQTTGKPVPGASKAVFLRLSLADKLAQIDEHLKDPFFANFFGGPVELYIEDGLRPTKLQELLYKNTFPELIRHQYPDIDQETLEKKIGELIARPTDSGSPSPHVTGGAVDVVLRYRKGTRQYVGDARVLMGYEEGEVSERAYPDYYELHKPRSLEEKLAQKYRRAYFSIMTGKAFGIDTQLQVNPTEWWHWSYGDQMWAKLRHQPAALYGQAELEP